MDLVVPVRRIVLSGETVIGSDYETNPGGKGANQAVAASRMGASVRFVGCVGSDTFGSVLRESLESEGIDTRWLRSVTGPSGVAFIQVDDSGQNCIVVSPGANNKITQGDLSDAAFAGSRVLVLQMEIPLEVSQVAARTGREAGAKVILNLAPAQLVDGRWLDDVTHLCLNEHEASLLLSTSATDVVKYPESAAKKLVEMVPNVIITLGDKGAVWAQRGSGGGVAPAFLVEAIDTTAAGDSFIGALAVKIAQQGDSPDLGAAVRFASAAGALAATKRGAQPSLPYLDEVRRLMLD